MEQSGLLHGQHLLTCIVLSGIDSYSLYVIFKLYSLYDSIGTTEINGLSIVTLLIFL